MTSISQVVAEIIEAKPFLETALANGIINYSKLADQLLDEVQEHPELTNSEIKQSAVMMAIRRLASSIDSEFNDLTEIIESSTNLEMDYSKYNLFSVTIKRDAEVNATIQSLYNIVDIGQRDFLTITSGMTEVTIISNMRHQDQILDVLSHENILEIDTDLASISLMIPQHAFQTPGLFYLVTKQLYWDGINIREVVSTLTEMNFIVKQIDIPKVMSSLRKLVTR